MTLTFKSKHNSLTPGFQGALGSNVCKKACLEETINTHRMFKKIPFETHSFRIERRKHKSNIKLYPKKRGCVENLTGLFRDHFQVGFDIKRSESSVLCARDNLLFK
jgi:hypothetical protein